MDKPRGRMGNDEIHEMWPITLGVPEDPHHPDFMPDHVLDALLHDMAKVTTAWRKGHIPRSVAGMAWHANRRADRLLGIDTTTQVPGPRISYDDLLDMHDELNRDGGVT